MKSLFRRLLVMFTCASMLLGTLLPAGAQDADVEPAPSQTETVTTSGGLTMTYTATDYMPNTPAENELIYGNAGIIGIYGTDYYRFSDGYNFFVYRLTGEVGQMAYVVLDISMEYLVEVSTDNKNWTEVLNCSRDGIFREMRGIDLTSFFEFSSNVYLKISDATPQNGWGGQLRSLRYVTITGPNGELPAYRDISDNWTASTGDTLNAGEAVRATAGSEVTFEKTVFVPENWIGGELGLSFSWVESGQTPVVRIDGTQVDSVSYYGNNLTIPLPDGSNGKSVRVEVVTTATEDGRCGLWDSVRMGYIDMITMPESAWSFDGETRKIHENYFTDETDLVLLNALAGNYASTLYDGRFGLVSFNGMMRSSQLFYAHDTSRNLAALAMEEMYSPVVRLETIEELYKGVKAAMVPGSSYEMFLKVDARPKNVRTSSVNAKLLQMVTNQDVAEPFVDVYLRMTKGGEEYSLSALQVEDEAKEEGLIRTYTAGDVSALVDINWPSCMTDKPTTMTFSSGDADEYSIVFTNFQKLGREAANFSVISTENNILAVSSDGVTEIVPPDDGYITLSKNEGWYAHPVIITWDVKPQKILLTTNMDNTAYTDIEFVYSGSDKPTISSVPFEGIDVNLNWAYRVAKHIVEEGTYGANGYDPTYVCGGEGLGPGALAAAAYIFKKYDSPLAQEAEALALKANRDAYQASLERNHTPSYYLDRIQGCMFLNMMGYNEFVEVAGYYGQYVLSSQNSDGTFLWFDPRNVLTLQLVYEIIDLTSYEEAIRRYRNALTYTDEYIVYKGETLRAHLDFYGAGDLGYLGHMGDKEAVAHVMRISADTFDDSGVFDCSDINPYFLGWSLKGMMNIQYDQDDMKTIVKKGQSALYDADGNVEILDYPTAYMNNPYFYSDYILERPIVYGDINGSGTIDASDALLALQHSVHITTLEGDAFTAADVTNDGSVDATDALNILQYSVELIDHFPVEE